MAQVLKREQVGLGLEVSAEHKLQVKAGRNVTVDAGGVHVDLPEVTPAPKAVADVTISGTTVTKTFTDGTSSNETLPTPTVDVHLAGITFADGKLKATLSDGSFKEAEFTAELVVAAIEGMDDTQKGKVVDALLPKLLEAIKGEEVKDFADVQLGFLLKKDA